MPGASAGSELASALLDIAEQRDFSGAVVVSRDGRRLAELARGFEDRANDRQISLASRFGIASVVKGLTALTVASLVESDDLRLETTLRSLLPSELPLVDSTVTVEHLLGHTSGV
ncbi:MAG: beta-lactamase family protein, partial [Chloroflexota bacterium]|nr:beta-lactamase family protein [Chloroflexota bacterium]